MKKTLIALLLFAVFLVGCSSQYPANETPVINATGIGTITADPDTVEIRLAVITSGANKNVQEKNAEKTQKLIDAMLEIGLTEDEMQTLNVSFTPVYTWDKNKGNVLTGYRAENTILIKTKKTEKAGEITDKAVANGAETVGNLQFYLSDEGKDKLLDSAIANAVNDARKQADVTAQAAGVTIKGIKKIDIVKNYDSPIIFRDYAKLRMAADEAVQAPTPILPEDVEYSVTVNISFQI